MLGITEDGKTLEYLWYDGKIYKIKITDGVNDLNLNELRETYKKLLEEKEDQCKSILKLGGGLTVDRAAAHGFLLGWLVKSIKDNFEKLNDCKLNIQVEEEKPSEDEIRSYVAESLKNLAEEILTNDDKKISKSPVVRGDVDGLELF